MRTLCRYACLGIMVAALFMLSSCISRKLPDEFTYREFISKHPEMADIIIPAEKYQEMLAERERLFRDLGKEIPEDLVRLRIGTRIGITVWGEPDFSRTVTVNSDGKFDYYGMIVNVPAAGMSIDDMRSYITKELKRYLRNPVVNINLDEAVSQVSSARSFVGNVAILGEVRDPGVFGFNGEDTVFDIIVQAAGLTTDAEWGDVAIIRRDSFLEHPIVIICDANKFFKALTPDFLLQDVKLRPRDIVYVPRNLTAYEHFERDFDTLIHLLGNVRSINSFDQFLEDEFIDDDAD